MISRAGPPGWDFRAALGLWRTGRFARMLYPQEPGPPRRLETLRVGDAMAAGGWRALLGS